MLTGAGSLGMLFPPCLPVILYSVIASTTIANLGAADVSLSSVTMEKMFVGGLLPGVLMVVLAAWWAVRRQPKAAVAAQRFDAGEAWRALWGAKWELLLPVVALVALFGGFATPVENMPDVLQWLSAAIPLKHFLIIVHGTFLKGMPAAEIWTHAWPLLAIAAATLTLATLLVRSRLQ